MTFSEGETKVVVSQLKRERRKHLATLWIVLGFFAGLVAWWASSTVKNLPDDPEATVMKAIEQEDQRAATATATAAAAAAVVPRARPMATRNEARLWLYLSRAGKISVDGRVIGKGGRERVDVAPGGHVITAEFGKTKINHQLQVEAGDEVMVEFDDAKRAAEAKRLVPFGP